MDWKENLLVVCMEECAEIAQAASKALRFGLENSYPEKGGEANAEALLKEYIQLGAIIGEMQMTGILKIPSSEEIDLIREDKITTMKKWYFKTEEKEAAVSRETILYLTEVGILLERRNPEFERYNKVYDRKHGYYDENQYLKKDKCEAIAEAKKYVENGVPNTYAVITEQIGFPDKMTEQDMEIIDPNGICYDTKAVVYSVMKDKDGNIRENFIE